MAKRLAVRLVDETPSLALALASRAGQPDGPFLRTPEGFVLADPKAILEWLERTHPEPPLLPRSPIRRVAARLLEDWVDLWLSLRPGGFGATLERLAAHLEVTGFLLGRRPFRADWMLAAWLEGEVLVDAEVRARAEQRWPALCSLGERLLDPSALGEDEPDDALPITLLAVLEELGARYGAYLEWNHAALKERDDPVPMDPDPGGSNVPIQPEAERGRVLIGRELATLDRAGRRRVAGVYEPLRLWHVLTLPPAITEIDPGDPRSL